VLPELTGFTRLRGLAIGEGGREIEGREIMVDRFP
jgi:hypothetical protein